MITVTLVHDTRREKKGEKFPVKLRIIYGRKAKYYPTEIDLTREEFRLLSAKRVSENIEKARNELKEIEANARALVKAVKPFNFPSFEKKFLQKPFRKSVFEEVFQQKINLLYESGRVGSALSYECSLKSLISFKNKLSFEEITADFLHRYEQWMIKNGNSKTTVGIYLRSLRAVFNDAIEEGTVAKDLYPFGKKKYQIPAGRNIKKALTLNEIGKIYYYEPETSFEGEARAKDFWLFSYFANGINMKDIALLKYRNIQGDYIVFERAKTLRSTRSHPRPISIFITEDMRRVIDRWGSKPALPDSFIFPIIQPGDDPVRQRKSVQQFIHVINTWMKRIAEKTGISSPVTTYAARHSFSTVLKRSGASIEFISEALGHTDVKTTESYLDSFENETKKHFAGTLTAFKNEAGREGK